MADHPNTNHNTGHNANHNTGHKSEHLKPIKIPAVSEVQRTTTEKFALDKSEVDMVVEIGDVIDVRIRGEVVEFQDGGTIIILRKTGKAHTEGEVNRLTLDEMANKIGRVDK